MKIVEINSADAADNQTKSTKNDWRIGSLEHLPRDRGQDMAGDVRSGVRILGYAGMDWARVPQYDSNYVNKYSFWARVLW